MKLETRFETCFDENYAVGSDKQNAIYHKGTANHWDAATRIDWRESIDFDNPLGYDDRFIPIWGGRQWTSATDSGRAELRRNYHAYTVSQFLHGEQAAMLAAARLVEVMPDARSKQFAALQACDEARHVEIFDRLLKTKINQHYAIDDGLQSLIQQGLSDSRWDMVVLTTQILIEGLALAALQQLRDFSKHKLISDIGNYVLADEARHVAFGVQMLQRVYDDMTDSELNERREFAAAGLNALTKRLNPSSVWSSDNEVEDTSVVLLLKKRLTRQVNDITGKLFSRISQLTKEVRFA